LCFKISLVSSAEIDTSSLSDEIPVPDTSFKAVLNLPKPAEMSQLIRDSETLLDQMLLIGAYFNLRYPGSTLNTDLTQDINEMFPDLTEKESKERAEWVQKAITLYRWGVNKYEKIKEEMLVPPEPPLILSDDQYGFSDNEPYLPTDENQFAIKYDFKKIIPYSTNPKDMASTRARSQKTAEEKKHKTNFEKFKSMVDKLELSKLPRYGIDLPNPLIGDAGTTPWITKDFYKTRLLAELAVYEGEPQFLAGVHVVVPAHRIMLGTSLGRLLQKPQIDLISSQNIADFEVFYPVPFSMISDRMIGGYAGDFLFPIRITPQAPDKPVEMKVRIAFQDCDVRLECKPLEFEHDLLIETSEEDALSSFRNFVQQSFNNLPQPPKPEFSAETFEAQVQKETQNVDEIRLVMKAPSNINNIALFLEDKEGTTFKRPKISVHSGKIYAVFPLTEPVSNLIGRKFQLTAQLNQFEKITQTLTLTEATLHTTQNKASTLSLDLLLAGLLFVFTPIGFCLFLWLYTSSRRTDF
jgi:DsbC/DsbD-like thiol-disulfide interchange protein